MTGVALGLVTGAALGLFYFGSLWLTLRRVLDADSPGPVALVSYLLRLAVLGAGLYGVVRLGGVAALLAALVGVMAVRHLLIRRLAPDRQAPAPGAGSGGEDPWS